MTLLPEGAEDEEQVGDEVVDAALVDQQEADLLAFAEKDYYQKVPVEDMHFGTANGPMRLGAPDLRTVWWAKSIALVDGPPDPAIRPVFGLETSAVVNPESTIACSMAM